MKPTADTATNWWVICLCAQWCGVCREWRDAFMQAAAAHPQLRFAWVDVEDEAEAMGDVDIETFPTVLIADDHRPLFLGPVQPSGGQLTRLIASLLQDARAARAVSGEAAPLLARLAASVLPKP
jgi:thioredoxin-like negative regulator of GroEL